MLDKLSNAIKKTTDKIANAIFLDKNLVDQIVKDLQRSLIEADVNVSLVLEITQKIKKSALDERLKGIEKKEHIIKLLHDELRLILGEKRELKLGSKKNKFMMLGLYGVGKCVHANTKVQLSDGNIKKISDIYNENILNNEEKLKDGFIIDVSNKGLLVPSFNPTSLKIENKKVTHLWKLKKDELYKVYLDNGSDFSIKVTPEHPFFVLRNGQVVKIRAKDLEMDDWIATPQEVKIEGKKISLESKLRKLPLSILLPKEEIKQIFKEGKKTIKQINKELNVKRNYCKFTQELKRGQIPIELVNKLPNIILAREKNAAKIITVPTYLSSDFAEFLGYVMGDGNIRPNYVQISNEDSEIIDRIEYLSKILFNIEPKIKLAKRTRKMYDIRICSKTLVKIMSIFKLFPGKKGKNLTIPQEIIMSDEDSLKVFIRAYFDCDSYASLNKRYIELTSESQIIIQQFNMLLKRFAIISTISKKVINSIPYWNLAIKARYAEKYAERISYLIKRKRERVEKYKNIGLIQGCGNQDMIPLHTFLKETRQTMGFSIGEIQDSAVYSFGIYEKKGLISKEQLKKLANYNNLSKKGMYLEFLEKIQNKENIRQEYGSKFLNGIKNHLQNTGMAEIKENEWTISSIGQKYLQQIKETNSEEIIQKLSNLANSEVCWLPIKKISKIANDEEYVYDLTVEDNHSFIAEGFIVHNTTTISKLALYYSKRGSKVCAIGLDVHRPAASTQLKQLCDKINIACFIKPEEKDPAKIWKSFEKELEKYELVIIDTAGRDSLEKDLIKEIKSISKITKPTETLLVIPADIGQTARKQAIAFKEAVSITGVIITRMDSTAKAGGALTSCYEAKVPVIFIGTGEKPADLEQFNPESFLSRMLGMGDLETLMEKIRTVTDEKALKSAQKNIESGKLTLKDVQAQLESMESIGSMDKIMSLVPGFSKVKEKVSQEKINQQQEKLKGYKHAINSMTKEEIENPEIMEKETSRLQRISKGSGVSTTDIRNLIKQYKILKEMIQSGKSSSSEGLDQKTLMKMAKKLAKKGMRI